MTKSSISRGLRVLLAAPLVWPGALPAQFTEPPPPAAYALTGVTVVRADGSRVTNVNVVIRGGLIEAMGADVEAPADAEVLEGDSLLIYPGFIDAEGDAEYEFPEIEINRNEIPSWNPPRHAQSFMPHRLVVDHLTATGSDFESQRKKGIIAAAVHPTGRLMPGRGTLLLFRKNAETPNELVATPVLGPGMSLQGAQGVYPATLFAVIAFYRQTFEDARRQSAEIQAYERDPRGLTMPQWDPDLDILRQAMNGETRVFFRADLARDIQRVLSLARDFNLRPVIVGGDEAWKVADELRAQNVPVLVSLDFPEPERWKPKGEEEEEESEEEPGEEGQEEAEEEPAKEAEVEPAEEEPAQEEEELDPAAEREKERIENIYSNASRLAEAGVRFALTSGAGKAEMLEGARKAIEYGLSEEDALVALTAAPATLLGIPTVARIETGMPANFIVTDKPLFDEETKIMYTFVEGELERGTKPGAEPEEAPAVDITGTWDVTIDAEGETISAKLKVNQQGSDFSGTMETQFGTGTVKDGLVSGNDISFILLFEFGGETLEIEWTGTVEGEEASGSGEGPEEIGSFTWSAKRSTDPGEEQER